MPISGMILKKDGVMSVTGGTDVTFVPDGQTIPNGNHVVDQSISDIRVQANITVKNRPASYDAKTGKFQKEKITITLVDPAPLANGDMSYDLVRIEREVHPERKSAIAGRLNSYGAQLLTDTDLANLWNVGSVA